MLSLITILSLTTTIVVNTTISTFLQPQQNIYCLSLQHCFHKKKSLHQKTPKLVSYTDIKVKRIKVL